MTPLPDSLFDLYPDDIEALTTAWEHVRIPGPPSRFQLRPEERDGGDQAARFQRRAIQYLGEGDTALVLVDKVSPHAQFDLMISELSDPPRPTVADVSLGLVETLCRSALHFVEFVSMPEQQQHFGLEGGQLALSLNCDPYTRDRESCQALKHFHLHLLYWNRRELAPLARAGRLRRDGDPWLRRLVVDPLAFAGSRLLAERLTHKLPQHWPVQAPQAGSGLPPACLVRLDGWGALARPAFGELLDTVHQLVTDTSADLLEAFTGRRHAPPPWSRHSLLPRIEVQARLDGLGLSVPSHAAFTRLADRLHSLTPNRLARLARHPRWRVRHICLNQPCYGLNLYSPARNTPDAPASQQQAVWLVVQPRLFSAIGGAGSIALDGVQSVRILRGEGEFSEEEWRQRARFQTAFAHYNNTRLGEQDTSVRHFTGFDDGWR